MSAIVFHKWVGMELLSRMCNVEPLLSASIMMGIHLGNMPVLTLKLQDVHRSVTKSRVIQKFLQLRGYEMPKVI